MEKEQLLSLLTALGVSDEIIKGVNDQDINETAKIYLFNLPKALLNQAN